MAVLSCIALSGYGMELATSKSKQNNGGGTDEDSASSSAALTKPTKTLSSPTSTYTQNAQNVIQNSVKQLAIAASSDSAITAATTIIKQDSTESRNTITSEQSNTASPTHVVDIEKENVINKQRYVISNEPKNIVVKQILDKLLTNFISNKFAKEKATEVLKLLTSNTRNPYLIWDNGTRAQLVDFLEQQRINSTKQTYENVAAVYEVVSDFVFDGHKDELQIGGVFIRIYNEMPTFQIINPKLFITDLLEYLKQAYQFLTTKTASTTTTTATTTKKQVSHSVNSTKIAANTFGMDGILQPTLAPNHPQLLKKQQQEQHNKGSTFDDVLNAYNRSKSYKTSETYSIMEQKLTKSKNKYEFANNTKLEEHTVMALRSLISVIKSNAEVDVQCIGNFDIIFGFLSNNAFSNNTTIKNVALEAVALVSRNKECVAEIAACEILGNFLVALKDSELNSSQIKVLETLSGLMNAQEMIKEAQSKGAVIYLLDMFCNSRNPQIRETCAEVLSKMTADRLSGPKVRITINKFLPPLFVDAMIESPQTSVQLFESIHEHPELIWNDRTRSNVCDAVADTCSSFYRSQKINSKFIWKDPDILKDIVTNEIVVAGVYLRLFVSNPAWTLRKPKQFLSELLDFVVDQISKSSSEKDVLDLSTTALVELLRSQPNLSDEIPILGHIPKLFNLLSVQPKNTLSVLHQLSLSEFCVSAVSQTECILPLKKCMEHNRNCIEKACETLSRLFKHQHDSLISQSLEVSLIPFLLGLLDSRLEFVDNPSTVKAQIVAALKGMTHNLNYGDRVTQILLKHPVWSEFKDQRHDLFITDTNVRGYLTGINPTAGYLTQAPTQNVEVLTSPPPIDRDDPSARPPSDL